MKSGEVYTYFPSRKELTLMEKYVYGDGGAWDEQGKHGRQTCPDCEGRLVIRIIHGSIGQAFVVACLTDGCKYENDITDYGCW